MRLQIMTCKNGDWKCQRLRIGYGILIIAIYFTSNALYNISYFFNLYDATWKPQMYAEFWLTTKNTSLFHSLGTSYGKYIIFHNITKKITNLYGATWKPQIYAEFWLPWKATALFHLFRLVLCSDLLNDITFFITFHKNIPKNLSK